VLVEQERDRRIAFEHRLMTRRASRERSRDLGDDRTCLGRGITDE
jgi:hypothetical protein